MSLDRATKVHTTFEDRFYALRKLLKIAESLVPTPPTHIVEPYNAEESAGGDKHKSECASTGNEN